MSIPTCYLLDQLTKTYQDIEFKFIMGADLLTGIRNWEDGYRLVKDFKFILVDRPNYKME